MGILGKAVEEACPASGYRFRFPARWASRRFPEPSSSGTGTTLVDFAHKRGIPADILKGHVRQESVAFNRQAYRYEPIGNDRGDWTFVSAVRDHSAGAVRTQEPYSLYRLATSDGLPDGSALTSEGPLPEISYVTADTFCANNSSTAF